MTKAFIYDSIRTPRGRGKPDGSLYGISPAWLVRGLLQSLQTRHRLDTALVDDLILGCVTPIGEQGANLARIAAVDAGWGIQVPGLTINRFCASGLEAIHLAAARVNGGQESLIVAGGVESMSRVPIGSDGGAWMSDPRVSTAMGYIPQGVSADLIATLEGFSRVQLDQYASQSHQRAARAQQEGRFTRSVTPVMDVTGTVVLHQDECIRAGTTPETLARLRPSFAQLGQAGFDAVALMRYPQLEKVEHLHHSGNASALGDAASLTLVGNAQAGQSMGLPPRARIRAMAVVGSEPTIMLTGTTPACRLALSRAGMQVEDIDLWEINEAFASVPLKTARDLGLPLDRVNVNGGAIAMGHPLGATGSILLGTLLDELERRDLQCGLVSLCAGAGMGIATVIERV